MNTENILRTDFGNVMPLEFISSLLTMLLICIFCLVVYFKGKKYKPLDKPKGIVSIGEMIVSFADKQVEDLMGPVYGNFAGYVIALAAYIFVGFMIGMIGIPNFMCCIAIDLASVSLYYILLLYFIDSVLVSSSIPNTVEKRLISFRFQN